MNSKHHKQVGPYLIHMPWQEQWTGQRSLGHSTLTDQDVHVYKFHASSYPWLSTAQWWEWIDGLEQLPLLTSASLLPYFDVLTEGAEQVYLFTTRPALPSAQTPPTLDALLEKRPNRLLLIPDAMMAFQQIVEGIATLHQRNLIHRTLNPRNIHIDWNQQPLRLQLSEYGFSALWRTPHSEHPTALNQAHYTAPELLDQVVREHPTQDIYALGTIFWQMLTGELPPTTDQAWDLEPLHTQLMEQDIHPFEQEHIMTLLQGCIQKDPKKRWKNGKELLAQCQAPTPSILPAQLQQQEQQPLTTTLGQGSTVTPWMASLSDDALPSLTPSTHPPEEDEDGAKTQDIWMLGQTLSFSPDDIEGIVPAQASTSPTEEDMPLVGNRTQSLGSRPPKTLTRESLPDFIAVLKAASRQQTQDLDWHVATALLSHMPQPQKTQRIALHDDLTADDRTQNASESNDLAPNEATSTTLAPSSPKTHTNASPPSEATHSQALQEQTEEARPAPLVSHGTRRTQSRSSHELPSLQQMESRDLPEAIPESWEWEALRQDAELEKRHQPPKHTFLLWLLMSLCLGICLWWSQSSSH